MTGQTDTVPAFNGSDPHTHTPSPRMWNAAWRQHRYWVIGTVALVAVGGLALAVIALLIPECASTAWWETPGGTCDLQPVNAFWQLYQLALSVLPVLAGAVLGAVTFGSDKEHRTDVYALTQGVSRIRWWTSKVVTVAAPVFIAAALLGTATLWVVDTSDASIILPTRTTSPNFDTLGLIPATRFLVAYAAAAAAALIWRTVGGIVTGVVVAGVVIAGTTLLQPLVVPHTRDLVPIQTWWNDSTGMIGRGGFDSAYNWSGYADSEGRDIDPSTWNCADPGWIDCVKEAGAVYRVEMYVSDAEYPLMMIIISALNLVIAGTLLAGGAAALRRRDL